MVTSCEMFRRIPILVSILVVFKAVNCYTLSERNLTYSFRVPSQWGQLTLETAGCCPYLTYPNNETSVKRSLPNFIGLGVMKCGSTTLSWYLSSHPDFALSSSKETHFMAEDYNQSSLSDYEQQWSGEIATSPIKFEFTPSYIWLPFSACRMKKVLPEMKFVVILRDPADRAYSEFNMVRQLCYFGDEVCVWKRHDYLAVIKEGLIGLQRRNCTFDNGVGTKTWNDCFQCLVYNDDARVYCHNRPYYFKDSENAKFCFAFGEQIISRGLYAAQMAWWFSLFPPENFVVILSHDFYSDPVFHLNRVGEFIGVERKFEQWMLPEKGHEVQMKGEYNYSDIHKAETRELLKKFYARPNLELYQLLDSNNHGHYTHFESQISTYSTPNEKQTQSVNPLTSSHQGPVSDSVGVTLDFDNSFPASGTLFFGLLSTILLLVVLWHFLISRKRNNSASNT